MPVKKRRSTKPRKRKPRVSAKQWQALGRALASGASYRKAARVGVATAHRRTSTDTGVASQVFQHFAGFRGPGPGSDKTFSVRPTLPRAVCSNFRQGETLADLLQDHLQRGAQHPRRAPQLAFYFRDFRPEVRHFHTHMGHVGLGGQVLVSPFRRLTRSPVLAMV